MLSRSGNGRAIAHHGELLQGVFEDDAGGFRRGLLSLPCPVLTSRVKFTPDDSECVTVHPSRCEKARRATELAIKAFAPRPIGGHIRITTDIPVGRGMGSSTADVLASIKAVLDYLGIQPASEDIMAVAVKAETACDSTLFRQQAVLFAQRDGFVLEAFRKPVPPLSIISVDMAPGSTVSTLDLQPAEYGHAEVELFRPLRSLLRHAINKADVRLLGRVATASALINERFLPKPRFLQLREIAARFGAAGLQVAHSGTMAGLMFDPGDRDTPDHIRDAVTAIEALGLGFDIFHM